MQPVLIDTDPGTDDVLALVMALNSPDLDVVGITTVGGNARLTHTTRNALRLLAYMGRKDIPVSRGASRPLRGKFEYGYYYHGPGGLSIRLPPTDLKPQPASAYDLIIDSARRHRDQLVVIALGPLTNLARAIRREPRVAGWVKEVIVMGGAIDVPGNVTAHAEFNIYNDPEAADLVFSSRVPTKLVGLDVTHQTYVARDQLPWVDSESPGSSLASKVLMRWFETRPDQGRYFLHDPLAVAAALRPDLLTYREAHVHVETADPSRRGKTTATYGPGPVHVATAVDTLGSIALIRNLLTSSPFDGKGMR